MLFNENMSESEAMFAFFNYIDAHRGEDLSAVKEEYKEIVRKIIAREMNENRGKMTSYHIE